MPQSIGWPALRGVLIGALLLMAQQVFADPAATLNAAKPRVAIFPLAGNAPEEVRVKYGFSLRAKLDRDGAYEVVDGPRMQDITGDEKAIALDAPVDHVKETAANVDATVLIWGEVTGERLPRKLRLHVLDLRQPDAQPALIEKEVAQTTDLRFAVEAVLAALPGVKPFEHPNEAEVHLDARSVELWNKNLNLVTNPDFSQAGHWEGIYQSEKYPVAIGGSPPAVDKVSIYDGALAMNLSRQCAESNGMACLSDAIAITPKTRYRLSFKYKSNGPSQHVFVKGYTPEKNIRGETVMREIDRRQVSPTGATGDGWREVVCDVNPGHPYFPVVELRIDLFAYLKPGTILFRDVTLKDVGEPTDIAGDKALQAPVTRPAARKD